VTHPFASPLFRLARIARSRLVRVFACLLALSIATSGFAAAAMPLHGANAPPAGENACAHHAQTAKARHVHRADGCCGTACACAFAHAVGLTAATPITAYDPAGASMPAPLRTGAQPPRLSPPLRPPIA
jgi:hypothetical protein